jgi:hypothetical protein
MTIDERLDRLTERTEAIAESLELVVLQVRDVGEQVRALGTYIHQDAENIRALARVAEIHERRLTHLEGGEPA